MIILSIGAPSLARLIRPEAPAPGRPTSGGSPTENSRVQNFPADQAR